MSYKTPKMLCNDCLKVYYHYDPKMHMAEACCEFCKGLNVCGCFNCIGFAYGQLDLDMGGRLECIGGHKRSVKRPKRHWAVVPVGGDFIINNQDPLNRKPQ